MLISAELRLPYKRTKVSKKFAAGFERDAFALQDEAWWRHHGFDLRLGARAVALDPHAHSLDLAHGQRLTWDRLVLAVGATANQLPLDDETAASSRVHHAHDISQVEALRAAAAEQDVRTTLVVGAGAMGVEVAEQLRRMGKKVTLTGDTPAPLAEELNLTAQERLASVLAQNGLGLRCDTLVKDVTLAQEGGLNVRFQGPDKSEARRFDLVVLCMGTRLRVGLARRAGLAVERGVKVDANLRTSCADIFAAGDIAQHPDGRVTYLWRHAMEQGRVAGLNALGGEQRHRHVPFRLKVKVFDHYFFALDRPAPEDLDRHDVVEVRDGPRYLCAYYLEGRLKGLVMMDDEQNQKRYNQAVGEGWSRKKLEEVFGG